MIRAAQIAGAPHIPLSIRRSSFGLYGIDNRLTEPGDNAESASNAVKCAQRLGGMLRSYHRAAAWIDSPVKSQLEIQAGRVLGHYAIKDECLNRMVFFGERSLRNATHEYAAHYHRERNHQGIDNRLIEPEDRAESASSAIECAQRLGGMLRFYHRAAA
jgi:hypothetical protein